MIPTSCQVNTRLVNIADGEFDAKSFEEFTGVDGFLERYQGWAMDVMDAQVTGLYRQKMLWITLERNLKELKPFQANIAKDHFDNLKEWQQPQEDLDFFDEANQCDWFMPENYCPNLVDILYGMCTTETQRKRVDEELTLFIQHGMFDMLFYLKYLVDTMRENNIVWGVGRGSSVASYVLYLIGIHKIDSIKYELDINEFLR
jgi:DNA polymerase III alpha subunit